MSTYWLETGVVEGSCCGAGQMKVNQLVLKQSFQDL